jgi:polyisoprenoid-binding protein YceI
MTTTTTEIPGYVAGTWTIDPVHSDVSFVVRHMVVSKVRGFFRTFEGTLVTGENPADSSVTASIAVDSIDTNDEQRNGHLRSADFFEVEKYPTMTYQSTSIRQDGGDWLVEGDLTLKGVTKQVPLKLELNGFGPDAYGGYRAGFSAKAEINRQDFGVSFSATMETGGLIVSDKVTILLEVEAILDKPVEG